MEKRDIRDKNWLWIDNEYLDKYARYLGVYATSVYLSICRHVDNVKQQSYPSMKKIAKEIGISVKTVERATISLEEWGLITIERVRKEDGTRANNLYTVLSKRSWKSIPTDSGTIGTNRLSEQEPTDSDDVNHPTVVPYNYTHNANKTQLKKPRKILTDPLEELVNTYIPLFSTLNRGYQSFFKNKTQREAIKTLIGFTHTDGLTLSDLVEMAASLHGKEYAPQIFTPTEMVEKYSKLLTYKKKEKELPVLTPMETYAHECVKKWPLDGPSPDQAQFEFTKKYSMDDLLKVQHIINL